MAMLYRFDVVGGRWEGIGGLQWVDDGEHPLPERILVGRCDPGVNCGTPVCGVSRAHISFWTLEEDFTPPEHVLYELEDEHVRRADDGELAGRAVYVVGGLMDPRNFGARAHEPLAVA